MGITSAMIYASIRRVMAILSVVIITLSLVLMTVLASMDKTAMIIVLSDVLFACILLGIPLLIISSVTKPNPFQTKQNKFFKGILIAISSVTIVVFTIPTSVTSITDLSSVLSDNFYYIEGEVTSTFITSSNAIGTSNRSSSYTQRIIIGDSNNIPLKYHVSGTEDYRLLEGEYYRVKALPNSKLILEYEQIKQ